MTSTPTSHAPAPAPAAADGAGRIAALVGGSIAALIALALFAAGGALLWANSKKDDSGYLSTSSHPFASSGYAIATANLDAGVDAPRWLVDHDRYGRLRLRTHSDDAKPVFVGIARTSAVRSYLRASAHTTLADIDYDPFRPSYRGHAGAARPAPPAAQAFWAASAHGSGTQSLTWKVRSGQWSIVVMNADASRGVHVQASAGATVPFVGNLAWLSLGGGALFALVAGGLIALGARWPRAYDGAAPGPAVPAAA